MADSIPLLVTVSVAEFVLVHDSVHSSVNSCEFFELSYDQATSSRLMSLGTRPRTYGLPMVVL